MRLITTSNNQLSKWPLNLKLFPSKDLLDQLGEGGRSIHELDKQRRRLQVMAYGHLRVGHMSVDTCACGNLRVGHLRHFESYIEIITVAASLASRARREIIVREISREK